MKSMTRGTQFTLSLPQPPGAKPLIRLIPKNNLFSYRCGDTSIPQSVATVCFYFSSGKGSWEELAGASEGVERDEGRYRQHRASGLLIRSLILTGLIDESQTQTEVYNNKSYLGFSTHRLFSSLNLCCLSLSGFPPCVVFFSLCWIHSRHFFLSLSKSNVSIITFFFFFLTKLLSELIDFFYLGIIF